jgi:hypothetical protein
MAPGTPSVEDILSANFPHDFDGFLKIPFSVDFRHDADFVT